MTEDEVYAEIGRRLRVLRRWRKMSQLQVANGIRMARASIANIERGCQHTPLWTLICLSALLAVPPHVWLLKSDDWQEWCQSAGVEYKRRVLKEVRSVKRRRIWVEEREVAT